MSTEYMAQIEAHVAQFGAPNVVSIADDIHIFHFEPGGNWKHGKILFVNRNGHHFRLIWQEANGDWLFVKNWNGMFDYQQWAAPGLRGKDPEALIRLCGVGPQGNVGYETLCLLPRETTQRRKAVWRGHMLAVQFDRNSDRFTISIPPGVAKSASFFGKLWLSKEASVWCRANLDAPTIVTAHTPAAKQEDAETMMELEGSGMWGMF